MHTLAATLRHHIYSFLFSCTGVIPALDVKVRWPTAAMNVMFIVFQGLRLQIMNLEK